MPRGAAYILDCSGMTKCDPIYSTKFADHALNMSITRQLLNEFRPLFRMLEEPLGRTFGAYGIHDPIFTAPRFARPAVDVSEDGGNYVVETELPGVKKEDMEVRVGDGGRSVTIEGKIMHGNGSTDTISGNEGTMEGPTPAGKNQLSVERSFTGSSRFSRTVWLPRPADAKNVKAKLADGILTLRIPKVEENDGVKIDVE